jgi:hypothetical protein
MQKGADRRKELNTHQATGSVGRISIASPETSGKSVSTPVDPALALNERGKRLSNRLVLRRIPQHARPLRSCSLVDFLTISGAQDHSGKRFVSNWHGTGKFYGKI